MIAFVEGAPALLIDSRGKRFLLKLEAGRTFQTDLGSLSHDELIGSENGSWVTTSSGARLLLVAPRLSDYLLRMKRAAQVVYPKDIGPILMFADIYPGLSILEAGSGSGALALSLARAVGESGSVVSVDVREDHAKHARKTLERWYSRMPEHVRFEVGDVAAFVEETKPDRIVLDLPEPGPTLEAASQHQPSGGLVCVYLPTVPQVEKIVHLARELGTFAEIEVTEVLMRDWNVDGRSVRPAHRMVGHTGFLTFMRRVSANTN